MDLGTLNWSVEVDTTDLSRAEREMDGTREAASGAKRGVDDFGDSTTSAGRKVRTATERMERDFRSTSRATDMLRNAVSGLVGVLGVREVIRYADAWQNAENMIRLVTRSTGELAAMQERVTRTAIETRSSFEGTARLYSRLAQSTTELALSNSDLIGLTRTINQSFAISGATAEEASNAITQLSQGLQSGALRGEEFNSVAEQAPTILRAVAASLNMGIGELREFAATGGITAEILVDALQGASESIGTQFAGSVATFGQQMEVARTQMTQFVGENSNVRSVVSGLGNVITGVTGSINDHSTAFNVVTGAIGGAATAYYGYATAVGVASKATALFTKILRVNPLIAAATAIASIAGAMYSARDAAITFGDTQGTLAQWMQGTWTTLSNLFKTEFAGAIDTAADAFGPLGQKAGEVATYLWGTFKALLGNILDAAKMTVNGSIAYFLTMRDTMGIVARAIRDQFVGAFDNVLNIAAEFWQGIKSIFSGEIDFSGFQAAVADGIIAPLAGAGGEIAESFARNFSADYLGKSIQFFSEEIESFGDSVARNVRVANTEFKTLDEYFLKAPETISKIPPELEDVSDKAKESAISVSRLDESVNSLLDRLDPVRARTQAYAQGVGLLNTALATGTLNFGDYQRGMVALQEELYAVEDATDTATSEMQKVWEQRMERMDAAGVDMWRSFLNGSEDALSSFKSLAINTLAEVIHAYTTQKITASFGFDLSGKGAASGGMGGIGSLINSGKSLLGFGTQATGPALSGGFMGATATQSAGSLYGMAATGGVAPTSLMTSITSGISAAMPWLAGGFAVDNILGLGIVDGITDAIGSLFGSKKTFDFDFQQGGNYGVFGDRESAFGQSGITSFSDFKLDQQPELDAMLDGIAELDNALAAAAIPERFDAMKTSIEDFTHSGPENLVESRLRTMIEGSGALGAEALLKIADPEAMAQAFLQVVELEKIGTRLGGHIVNDIADEIERTGNVTAAATQMMRAVQTAGLLADSSERLNLQFDVTASGAIHAASALTEMVGGVENLANLQSSYYQNFFSEAERAENLQNDLTASLFELGFQLPETRDGFRALVEAQDLHTESGQRNYATLLQLSSGFDQLRTTLDGMEGAVEVTVETIVDATAEMMGLSVGRLEGAFAQLSRSVDAEQQILQQAYQATTNSIQSNMRTVEDAMRSTEQVASSLRSSLNGMLAQNMPQSVTRQNGQAALREMLSGGVSSQADLDRALSAVSAPSEGMFSTFEDYQRDFLSTAQVISQLSEETESQLTIEQQSLRALERQLDNAERQYQLESSRLEETLVIQRAQLEAEFGQASWLEAINGGVQSIPEALQALASAIADTSGRMTQSAINVSQGRDAGGATLVTGGNDPVSQAYRDILGRDPDAAGLAYFGASGGTEAQIREALKASQEYQRYQDSGIPGFANGGAHSGGWRVVGERGPELEYTGPSRINSNNDIMQINNELTNEVKQLRDDLRQVMRPIAENTGRSADTLEGWDYNGTPAEREEVSA